MDAFSFTRGVALLGDILACNARVEGMKAENAHRAACGNGPTYGNDAFEAEAYTLRTLADAARGLA